MLKIKLNILIYIYIILSLAKISFYLSNSLNFFTSFIPHINMHVLYTALDRFPIFVSQTLNKVENNGAAVYVGSSLTAHNPLFFVHNSRMKKLMWCFYWSVSLKWLECYWTLCTVRSKKANKKKITKACNRFQNHSTLIRAYLHGTPDR